MGIAWEIHRKAVQPQWTELEFGNDGFVEGEKLENLNWLSLLLKRVNKKPS